MNKIANFLSRYLIDDNSKYPGLFSKDEKRGSLMLNLEIARSAALYNPQTESHLNLRNI